MTASLDEARRFVRLAQDDLAAFRALVVLPQIRRGLAFFHAQQAIEKSLKAVLFAHGIPVRKTHDLFALADVLNQSGIATPHTPEDLASATPYAVEYRYGDEVIASTNPPQVEALAVNTLAWASKTVNEGATSS